MQITFEKLTGRKSITASNRYVPNATLNLDKGENVVHDVKVGGLPAGANDMLRGQLSDTYAVPITDIYWRNPAGEKISKGQVRTSTPKTDLWEVDKAYNGVPLDLVIVAAIKGRVRVLFHLLDR